MEPDEVEPASLVDSRNDFTRLEELQSSPPQSLESAREVISKLFVIVADESSSTPFVDHLHFAS